MKLGNYVFLRAWFISFSGSILLCATVGAAEPSAPTEVTAPSATGNVAPAPAENVPTPITAPAETAPVTSVPTESPPAVAAPEPMPAAPVENASPIVSPAPEPVPVAPTVDVKQIFLVPKVGPDEVSGLEWVPTVLPRFDKDGEKGGQVESVILVGKFSAAGSTLLFGESAPIVVNADNSFSLEVLLTSSRTTNFLTALDAVGNVQRQFFTVEVPGWTAKNKVEEDSDKPTRWTASLFYNSLALEQNSLPHVSESLLSAEASFLLLPDIKRLFSKLDYGIGLELNAKVDFVPVSDPNTIGLKYYHALSRLKKGGATWAEGRAHSTYSLGGLIAGSRVTDYRYGLNLFIGSEFGYRIDYQVKENLSVGAFFTYTPVLGGTEINIRNSILALRLDVEPKTLYKITNSILSLGFERLYYANASGSKFVSHIRWSLGIGKRF